MSLHDAFAAIMREHAVVPCSDIAPDYFLRWAMCEGCGWESRRIPAGEIRSWDETFRELDATHIAELQAAYLREQLAFPLRELIEPYTNQWGASDVGDLARGVRAVLGGALGAADD